MKKYIYIIFVLSNLFAFTQVDPNCCYSIPLPPSGFGARLDPNIPVPNPKPVLKDFANTSYVLNKPIVADLDVDGFNEIISFGASNATVINGIDYGSDSIQIRSMSNNPTIIKNIPFNSSKNNFGNVAVADLDNNLTNGLEIVAVDRNNKVHIISNIAGINGTSSLTFVDTTLSTTLPTQSVVPSIANLDNSGRPEVIIGNYVFYWTGTAWASTFASGNTSGSRDFNTRLGGTSNVPNASGKGYELPLAIDVLPSVGLEIVMGPIIYSFTSGSLMPIYNMNTDLSNLSGYTVNFNLNGVNFSRNIVELHDGYVSAGNLDSDSNIEIVVNGSIKVDGEEIPGINANILTGMYIVDPINNTLEAFINATSNNCSTSSNVHSFSGSAVTIADVDSAFPEAELIYLNTEQITVHNLSVGSINNYETWANPLVVTDCSGQTGITTFDFNGDGIKELVYRDQTDLRVMYGGTDSAILGVSVNINDRNWFVQPNVFSRTGVEYPTIVDLDNDNEAEIVTYGSEPWTSGNNNDVLGYLMVFESAPSTPRWGDVSPIWNQAQYFYRNINSDGTVPLTQLSQNTIVNGQKPYNLFLGQPNIRANDTLWKPDVNIRVLESSCKYIKVELCNSCQEDIPSGMPVTTYDKDPTLFSSASIKNQQLTSSIIPKNGGCITMIIPTNNTPGNYYIVANDNGSSTRPFNLSADFPNTNIKECEYDDNIANEKVTCPPEPFPDCCENPLIISSNSENKELPIIETTMSDGNSVSIAGEVFTFNTDATIPITEVRAVVTDLDFNYDLEACAECIDNPALWGSILGDSDPIGSSPNALERDPAPLPWFGDLNNIYNNNINNREIIWKSGKGEMIKSGDDFQINYLLPSASEIPCCATSVKICLEISYKDANCNVCLEQVCSTIELSQAAQEVSELNIGVEKNGCCERTLTANSDAYATYLWSTGETTKQIDVTENGTYTVTVSGGGTSISRTIIIGDLMTGAFPLLSFNSLFHPDFVPPYKNKLYIMDVSPGKETQGEPNSYNANEYKLEIWHRWNTQGGQGNPLKTISEVSDTCDGFNNWDIYWDGTDQSGASLKDEKADSYVWRLTLKNCNNESSRLTYKTTWVPVCEEYRYLFPKRKWIRLGCKKWGGYWNTETFEFGDVQMTR